MLCNGFKVRFGVLSRHRGPNRNKACLLYISVGQAKVDNLVNFEAYTLSDVNKIRCLLELNHWKLNILK